MKEISISVPQPAVCIPASSCNPNCGVAPVVSDGCDASGHPALLHGLDFLWLELTSKCNLQCVHCYAESGPGLPLLQRMTYADWLRMLREAAELGCRKLQFIGGEPTIYPQLPELIGEARRLGYDFVEVFTNGTTFTERIKRAFLTHKVHLAFSIYSAAAPVHDSITLHYGSFEKTKANIEWALLKGLGVRAAIIKMKENASKVERTRAFLEELGVKKIQVDSIRGVGRGLTDKVVESPVNELCGRCWEGKLCVTSTGKMLPCIFARLSQVGTVNDNMKNVIQGKPLMDFRSGLRTIVEGRSTLNGRS
jgi:sulfatase maturation enzyme AslB (radical SAM superfamily)